MLRDYNEVFFGYGRCFVSGTYDCYGSVAKLDLTTLQVQWQYTAQAPMGANDLQFFPVIFVPHADSAYCVFMYNADDLFLVIVNSDGVVAKKTLG